MRHGASTWRSGPRCGTSSFVLKYASTSPYCRDFERGLGRRVCGNGRSWKRQSWMGPAPPSHQPLAPLRPLPSPLPPTQAKHRSSIPAPLPLPRLVLEIRQQVHEKVVNHKGFIALPHGVQSDARCLREVSWRVRMRGRRCERAHYAAHAAPTGATCTPTPSFFHRPHAPPTTHAQNPTRPSQPSCFRTGKRRASHESAA